MRKIVLFLLLAITTITYGGCFLQEEGAQIDIISHTTPPMKHKHLVTYLKSPDNPITMNSYCRFTYKKGNICDLSQVIYAIIAPDHVQIFEAKDEDKELLDK